MSRRTIGVEISGDSVRAVQILSSRRALRVERVYTQPLGEAAAFAEELAAAVKAALTEGGFRRGAPVGVALSWGEALFCALETDLPKLRHVRRTLAFELEDEFPPPVDGLVLDIVAGRKAAAGARRVLVGAARRATLEAVARGIEEAGARCVVVDAGACALHAAVLWDHDVARDARTGILHVEGGRGILALGEGRRLVGARHFMCPDDAASATEIELTWRDVFGEGPSAEASLAVCGEQDATSDLAAQLQESLECEVAALDPLERSSFSDGASREACSLIAVGAALRAAGRKSEGVNFLEADSLSADPAAEMKKGVVLPAVLLALIAGALVAGLFVRLNRLEGRYSTIKRETRAAFKRILPGEKHMVNPLAQVDERLKTLRKEYEVFASIARNEVAPLRVLQAVSAGVAAEPGARITEMRLAGRTVRLKGTIGSFRSLERLKRSLEAAPEFRKVSIESVDAGRSATFLRFKLVMTVAGR